MLSHHHVTLTPKPGLANANANPSFEEMLYTEILFACRYFGAATFLQQPPGQPLCPGGEPGLPVLHSPRPPIRCLRHLPGSAAERLRRCPGAVSVTTTGPPTTVSSRCLTCVHVCVCVCVCTLGCSGPATRCTTWRCSASTSHRWRQRASASASCWESAACS